MKKEDVLYIKWRPKKFNEIVGQKITIKYFKNSLFLNKIHHSYLLIGNRGVGKTTIARLLVKSFNCINIKDSIKKDNNNFPCGICSFCLSIENNNFIDFIELDAATKSGIDDIKDLLDGIKYFPIKGKYKIYLIDEIHMLSKQAFSALLKSLEEPPLYIKFILATTEIKKIPETIISRCIILNLKEISNEDITKKLIFILKKEKIDYEIEALNIISNFSNGSMRDALNILEKSIIIGKNYINKKVVNDILGICDIYILINIIKAIINKDNKLLSIYLNKFSSLYLINYNNLFIQLLDLLHNIFMLNIDKNYIINPSFNKFYNDLLNLSIKFNLFSIKNIYKTILNVKKNVIFYPSSKIAFEMSIIHSFYLFNNIID